MARQGLRVVSTVLVSVLISCAQAPQRTDGIQPVELDSRVTAVITGLRPSPEPGKEPSATYRLADRMVHHGVPGVSIAVIHDGRIDWARGYGIARRGAETSVTEDTLFQAASISKALTAVVALRLVEDGLLALDIDVNEYLTSWEVEDNEFTDAQNVTLEHLLSHTAGLNVPGFRGYAQGEAVPTLREILDGASPANSEPLRIESVPGETWKYSGGGYCVVQQLLKDVTDSAYVDLMDRLLLEPVGMKSSTFRQLLPREFLGRAAHGHRASGEAVTGGWHTYPEMAAAGLWTTASDLARFARSIQESVEGKPGSVLSSEMAERLTTPRFGAFSLGLLVRGHGASRWFTYNGGNEGFRCLMYAYLEAGAGAVVMTNSDSGMELAAEIINSIASEYSWPDFVPEG